MTHGRRWLTTFGLVTSVALTGCSCGPETRGVTFSTPNGSLTLVRDGVTRHINESAGRFTEFDHRPEDFQFVYNTIEGSTTGEGIRLSIGGDDPTTNEQVILV